MLAVVLECVRMSNCPWHTDQTNPNKTVNQTEQVKHLTSKMENEEAIHCNLETLLVLLCLKVARLLQTRKKYRKYWKKVWRLTY